MSSYCVVGSLNSGMVTRVPRFPEPGETMAGINFSIYPGGKGANQAVALARLDLKMKQMTNARFSWIPNAFVPFVSPTYTIRGE
jgi:sugar/nucleoside kinase (ribokinase family)